MKPESLSRALAKLKPIGISTERDIVSIEDIGKVVMFVEDVGEDE